MIVGFFAVVGKRFLRTSHSDKSDSLRVSVDQPSLPSSIQKMDFVPKIKQQNINPSIGVARAHDLKKFSGLIPRFSCFLSCVIVLALK